jgi:hypothetical protein
MMLHAQRHTRHKVLFVISTFFGIHVQGLRKSDLMQQYEDANLVVYWDMLGHRNCFVAG